MKRDKDDYKYYLSLMHEQVKYAESKNSAVIVFSGAFLIGLLNSLSSLEKLLNFSIFGFAFNYDFKLLNLCIFLLSFGLFLSILISLISFFPKIKTKDIEILNTNNILFFKSNINFKSGYELKNYYDNRYRVESRLILDYCNQIFNLSIIAQKKYNYFKCSLFSIFFFLLLVLIILIIRIIKGD